MLFLLDILLLGLSQFDSKFLYDVDGDGQNLWLSIKVISGSSVLTKNCKLLCIAHAPGYFRLEKRINYYYLYFLVFRATGLAVNLALGYPYNINTYAVTHTPHMHPPTHHHHHTFQ